MRILTMNAWHAGTLGIVILVAVANVVHTAQKTPPPPVDSSAGPADPVMRQEQRLAGLRGSVEARGLRGTIGYLGDPPTGRPAEDARGVEDYFLTQFALAPLVLDGEAERHEWIATNLRGAAPLARVPAGWKVAEDFGGGVLLLKKAAP
jgi:hypothetical protein